MSHAVARTPLARALLSLAAVVALVTPSHAQAQGGPKWPFATPANGDPMSMREGRDLWNLGLLGAKASDAAAPPPAAPTNGTRRIVSTGADDPKADEGPVKLRVECLLPDGPAAKAGLKVGDVVVGVNGANFEKSSMPALAQALVKAESGQGVGKVALTVEAAGKTRVVTVSVPAVGKDLADMAKPAARARVQAAALAWLATRQTGDGGYPETLNATGGAVVQASLAGLAWLAAGNLPGQGKQGDALKKALSFVTKNVDAKSAADRMMPKDGPNWNQDNWGWAHAGIFLGELHARQPSESVRARLQDAATFLQKSQVQSGGWGHGPGETKNALGYVELNIMAALTLNAVGLAKQAGCKIDEALVKKAAEYVEASSSGDGGVGYSTMQGQQGIGNIGRSAGAWLGYVNLGLTERPFHERMKSYVTHHIDDVLGGHASLMQHILLAGVAAQALGGEPEKKYWTAVQNDLILARAPDGSLQPRPWHETISMGTNTDVSVGEVWTTACWAIVLGASPANKPGPGLPAWCGRRATARK